MSELLTLQRQATSSIQVRAWHNTRREPATGIGAHAEVEVSWLESGSPTRYAVGHRSSEVTPGRVMVVPAHIEHRTTMQSGARARVIVLSDSIVAQIADAMGVGARLAPILSVPQGRLLRLCSHIFEESVEQAVGCDLALDALTEALAVELLRGERGANASPRSRVDDLRIRRALAFIDASYAEPLSLDAIAKAAGMTRYHFGRVFEAQVGRSPYRHLVDVRIERAARLIGTGRVSVTEAALSVGFNDLGRFGRAFRVRHGVTPSEALAASRGKRAPAGMPRIA